jgi:DUF4097 and DUF4098 domain-containing protein YvlB
MHRHPARLIAYFGILTGLMAIHAQAGGRQPLFDRTLTTNLVHLTNSGLAIRTDNGAIDVQQSDRHDISLTARIRCVSPERLAAVEISAERTADGTLDIHALWPDGKRKNNEGCSFELLLPDASNVDLRASNGTISSAGFSGMAELQTSNGKIIISGHDGPVHATTSNGGIDARNITGTLRAVTSNGRIDAQHIGGAAELRTSNGAINAVNLVSPLTAHTSNGSIGLELAPSFAGEMTASTSNGSLDIAGLKDAELISSGKKRITFRIGASGHESSASCSNGSIRIRSLR